jgi:hypothetical protein
MSTPLTIIFVIPEVTLRSKFLVSLMISMIDFAQKIGVVKHSLFNDTLFFFLVSHLNDEKQYMYLQNDSNLFRFQNKENL